MLAGANTDDPSFTNALANLRAIAYLNESHQLPLCHVLAPRVAQVAHDGLKFQAADCGEPVECEVPQKEVGCDLLAPANHQSHRLGQTQGLVM